MVLEVPGLKRLFLLGCEQLRGIKWDTSGFVKIKPNLELLCVDTRPEIKYPPPSVDKDKSLHVHAVIMDARLARSLCDLIRHSESVYNVSFSIHVISSPLYSEIIEPKGTFKDKIGLLNDQVNPQQQLISASQYHNVLSKVGDAPMQSFPRPPTSMLSRHVEIAQGSHNLESELCKNSHICTLADLAKDWANSLYVHDVSTNISMPKRDWEYLRLCRIEMCPMLETVFPGNYSNFYKLETIWVSDLLMARCIWSNGFVYDENFNSLQHMHVRCCPRLQFILHVRFCSFPNLETLHIIHCSDLRNIFVLESYEPINVAYFPKLATIHLHDLPMLRQICDFKMVAPELKTIKIRGCWSLRRLPAVTAYGPKPAIEIEKDVWDKLKWDGLEAGHHPSLYKEPQSSRYYRRKMPMVSILRYAGLITL
ncbi:hypothetical protein ABZP36_003017 [Zizania latifolia]